MYDGLTWYNFVAQMAQRVNGFVEALQIAVTRVELRPS